MVGYLPFDSFLQLGLFAQEDITKGSVIQGVAGFLAKIVDDEVVNGYNGVSIWIVEGETRNGCC